MIVTIRKIRNTPCGGCDVLNMVMGGISGKLEALDVEVIEHDLTLEPEIQTQYNVMSVPVLVYEVDGTEVFRSTGVVPSEAILEKILEISAR